MGFRGPVREGDGADGGRKRACSSSPVGRRRISADVPQRAVRCDWTAATFRLTPREREILGYLAHGRTQPYIQEALYLSRSIVSTHVKHIYQKLDVHSKQELIDLVRTS